MYLFVELLNSSFFGELCFSCCKTVNSKLVFKVPAEFVTQNNQNANPPTLILTLHSMIKDARGPEGLSTVPGWLFRSLTLD
jgi:hypothetical protein